MKGLFKCVLLFSLPGEVAMTVNITTLIPGEGCRCSILKARVVQFIVQTDLCVDLISDGAFACTAAAQSTTSALGPHPPYQSLAGSLCATLCHIDHHNMVFQGCLCHLSLVSGHLVSHSAAHFQHVEREVLLD